MSIASEPMPPQLATSTDRAELAALAEDTIARGSKSFAAAAKLFPPEVRRSAMLLYAWCRHCDDVVDGQQFGFARRPAAELPAPMQRLDALATDTMRALWGDTTLAPAFLSLADVVARHAIPARFPIEHLEGYRMDVEAERYATIGETLDYCYRVAGVVGIMMAMVMGARDDRTLDRASDLGIAFQLTNIARDIVEDARHGRVYVPAEWLAEAGLQEGDLTDAAHREAVAGLAARLVDHAEPYYRSAFFGLSALPARSAWAVATAHGVYRQIGLDLKARGADAVGTRISTGRLAKLRHVALGAAKVAATRLPLPLRRPQELYARPMRRRPAPGEERSSGDRRTGP
ncbi:phytoene/squalene synthase family protein [Jiella sonneratiae]|uniref:Phytoene/squalene synthase family protein n=1 Tax=Jiella sonneratiae TaxID=2816856 RepID=A0ABS3J8E3_9HYPH|nr:phytoene/squalene synthase family protein [Jiella sonneratiae]MBO0905943.1 phytoene/squalene synthase family protein [Jiella sonneratiae]